MSRGVPAEHFGDEELQEDELRDAILALSPDNHDNVEAKFETVKGDSKIVSLYGHYERNGQESIDAEATVTFRGGKAAVLVIGMGGKVKMVLGEDIYERPDFEEVVSMAESLFQEYQSRH